MGAQAALRESPALKLAMQGLQRHHAVEAAIWGMPAVNYDLMLQEMLTKTGARENEIVYWGKPLDWKNQTLTPNPDTIYLMCFFQTKDVGPVVFEVPPAEGGSLNANLVNLWQMAIEDEGLKGVDQGKGAKYLILPPGYDKPIPAGYTPLKLDTFSSYVLIRANLKSHSDKDVADAVAYGKRIKVYPLSQAASPPATKFTDAKDVLFDSTIRYDASFFEALNRIVQKEPWLERDRIMIDVLKSLGIERGKPFKPDAVTKKIFDDAMRETRMLLEAEYDAGLPPFFEGAGNWYFPARQEYIEAMQHSFEDGQQYPVDARGLTYTYAYIAIKHLGAGQFYLISIRDKDGDAFDGAKSYRLHVPANAPVEQYWSVTLYDRETHALIKNVDSASRASNAAEVQKNADGSVDLYFGPKAPAGKESNWVPTDPKRGWEAMFRLYGPKKEFFAKPAAWKLPDIEKVH
ncbi:MAG: DUF1254 domain-containing protein [Vitreimonas sp.]